MSYTVTITDRALRAVQHLPLAARRRVWARIRSLADDPRPPGCKPLHGTLAGTYRLRVGGDRVVYRTEDDRLAVVVVEVGTPGDVYDAASRTG